MSGTLFIRDRRRGRKLNTRLLRWITRAVMRELGHEEFDLGIYLVGQAEITLLNEQQLGHQGSTDVITFDYHDEAQPGLVHGEIFVCVDEALTQAKRFRTTWPSEVVRYVVHGVLHLSGYDDRKAADRKRMKRVEDALVKKLAIEFYFPKLSRSA